MDSIIDVAGYIVDRYKEVSGEVIDEMKLQKLLYFTQRESFSVLGSPAFKGDFEAWKYGPVSIEVRNQFCNGEVFYARSECVSDSIKYIANNVVFEYGKLASWKLSEISHKESSWINARKGLAPYENCRNILKLDDIKEDAKKVRPYDHLWDMYYDEFEDCDDNEF